MINLFEILEAEKYTVDAVNRNEIELIQSYLNSEQKKGLLLQGFYGTGKTWLMRIISEKVTPLCIVSTEKIMTDTIENANGGKLQDVPEKYKQARFRYDCVDGFAVAVAVHVPFCFDELGGQNDRKLNLWGTETYPMSIILKTHYEKGIKCHAITNYDTESLRKLYGGETVDRFKQMFEIVKLKGESRR